MNNNNLEDVKSMLHKAHEESIADCKAMASGTKRTCVTDSQRSAVERLEDYTESLDSMLARQEKGMSCLNLARELLIDYVYRTTVINKDDEPEYPPEIEITIKLIRLVTSDLELSHDIVDDDRKELRLIRAMVQTLL